MTYTSRTLDTPTGQITFQRAYYYCKDCGTGHHPWDQELGLVDGRQSPALQPMAALVGTLAPFGKAADALYRLSGVRLSESTCRRRTEEGGADLRARQARKEAVKPSASAKPWDFTLPDRDAQSFPGTVAYLGLDAFAVPTRPAGGGPVEYRMLYTGVLYDARKEHTVYVADYNHEEAARQLRLYACGFGLQEAATVVALTDGGNGLGEALRANVSDAVTLVLDYYHAVEHVASFTKVWHGRDSPAGKAWLEEMKGVLLAEGGVGLQNRLRDIEQGGDAGEEALEELRKLRGYVENNGHRMDYPRYRARGWDIGSGPTEAGCKVLSGRLKGTGMRWCVSGSGEVAALRALYASGEGLWDAFWEQHRRKNYLEK